MENRKQVHMIIGLGEHSNLGVFFNILWLTYEPKGSSTAITSLKTGMCVMADWHASAYVSHKRTPKYRYC